VTPAPGVVALLRERAASGSRPGAREDGHRVALVLEGGGMRGVVSAGMTAAIERLGLTDAFDLAVGASAGALNAAALLAGVARGGAAAYGGALSGPAFINPSRLLLGRPAVDVGFVLGHSGEGLDAGRHERTLASPIELRCVAVDVATAGIVEFSDMRTREDLWAALLATSRMPWVGGRPVRINGRRYLDGGLADAIPLDRALAAGATHALVLQTRPQGVPRSSGSRLADRLIERHLRGLNPALVELYRGRIAAYERVVDEIAARSAEPDPVVLGLRPPAGTPVVGQLERDPEVLQVAARDAEALATTVLRGGPPGGR
jgi:predicted patatin/cPLA2 family phospholipase